MSSTSQTSFAVRTANPRALLRKNLQGLAVHIPDLRPVFEDWRGVRQPCVNENLHMLKSRVQARLQTLGFDHSKRERLEASNFALFAALWWPEAPLERLETLAYLVIWLFTWDDEIDEPAGSYSDDIDAAQVYRQETLQFVRFHLGLSAYDPSCRIKSRIIQSVDLVCRAIRKSYTVGQLERLYQKIAQLVTASEQEQRGRLNEVVPTLEQYWRVRLGTSAVDIGSAVSEYSMSSHLPSYIINAESMRDLWSETNTIISITNDLLSFKKEMKVGGVDNVVALMFVFTNDAQTAVDESVAALRNSKLRFDAAARALLRIPAGNEQVCQQVADFIEVQRSNCVGNLVWSLETQRYSMRDSMNEDGSHTFVV